MALVGEVGCRQQGNIFQDQTQHLLTPNECASSQSIFKHTVSQKLRGLTWQRQLSTSGHGPSMSVQPYWW